MLKTGIWTTGVGNERYAIILSRSLIIIIINIGTIGMDTPVSSRLQYFEDLSSGIEETWNRNAFTDVEVVVDNHSYHCHRIILGSLSHYFNAMFSSGFREMNETKITLQDMDRPTFELILSFIYTGKNSINKENVAQLLLMSVMLQIPCLIKICEDFLKIDLLTDNCIGIWKIACNHGLKDLAKTSWNFIIRKFPEVSQGDEFKLLSVEELLKVVKDKKLQATSEEMVCDAVMNWIAGDEEETENKMLHFPKVWESLQFSSMSVEYLEVLHKKELLQGYKTCIDIIEKAILNKKGNDHINENMYREADVLCMVGTRSRHPDPQKTEVQCYSFHYQKVFTLSDLPKEPGPCFAVCSNERDIFISGGYVEKNLLFHFVSKENKWDISKMLYGRWSHGMVYLDGNIYIIGGMSTANETMSNIERVTPLSRKSVVAGALDIPVSSMTVAVMGHKIYIFGGKLSDRSGAVNIQCFDIQTNESSIAGHLPESCAGIVGRAVQFENSIYLVLRDGRLVEFTEDHVATIVCSTATFDHFGAVEFEENIIILGSQSSRYKYFQFDPAQKSAQIIPALFKPAMCNFHCLKIVLSKKYLEQSI